MSESPNNKVVVKVLVDYDRWKYLTDRGGEMPTNDSKNEENVNMSPDEAVAIEKESEEKVTTSKQAGSLPIADISHEQQLAHSLALDQQYVKKLNEERQLESMKKIKRPKQSFAARNKDSLDSNFWYMGK